MKLRVLFSVVLAALVVACGGSDQQQQAPDGAKPPPEGFQGNRLQAPVEGFQSGPQGRLKHRPGQYNFRTPGAPAQPESYKSAKAAAERNAKAGDTYVHAHLDMGLLDHCLTNQQQVDWATTSQGACYGDFKDGTYPFTGGRGAWSPWSKENGRISISIGTMHLPDDPAASEKRIDCYISDRPSGDCYTTGGSHLEIKVNSGDYILIRGMCKVGDGSCRPH
jgi:hypothetical protein